MPLKFEITPGLGVLYDDKSTWCRIIVDIWYSLFIAQSSVNLLFQIILTISPAMKHLDFKSLTLWSQLLDHCRFALEFDLNSIHVELQASYHENSRKNVTRLTTRLSDTSSGLGRSPSYLGTLVVSGICSKFFHISELLETKILSGLIKIYLLKGFLSSRADNSVRFTGSSCRLAGSKLEVTRPARTWICLHLEVHFKLQADGDTNQMCRHIIFGSLAGSKNLASTGSSSSCHYGYVTDLWPGWYHRSKSSPTATATVTWAMKGR